MKTVKERDDAVWWNVEVNGKHSRRNVWMEAESDLVCDEIF